MLSVSDEGWSGRACNYEFLISRGGPPESMTVLVQAKGQIQPGAIIVPDYGS